MILIDFTQTVIAGLMAQLKSNDNEINESMLRHMILNSLRNYQKRYGPDYGQIVLCTDASDPWRREFFPLYKANRKKSREADDKDWKLIFDTLHEVKMEIKENFPYKYMYVENCEADDIIAILTKHATEDVMIVSGDKDFIQLHKYNNVRQYSPITKKHVNGVDPVVYIKEHVLKGDRSDGIPNVLSPDHTFTDELRQRPLTSKRIESILAQEIDELDDEVKRNYQRNNKLINLDNVPEELEEKILDDFNVATCGDRSKLLNYFIDKRLKSLTEQIGDF